MKLLKITIALITLSFISGCKTLSQKDFLPSKHDESISHFDNYDDALKFFKLIKLGETNLEELSVMGFDIKKENVKLLNYIQVQNMFLSTASVTKDGLPDGITDCLDAKDGCVAYLMTIEKENEERYGNFFADMFQFRKKTNITGWRFEALFVVVDNTIMYGLHNGEPNINKNEVLKNPLGPINRMGGSEIFNRFL